MSHKPHLRAMLAGSTSSFREVHHGAKKAAVGRRSGGCVLHRKAPPHAAAAFHFDPDGALTQAFIAPFPDTAIQAGVAEGSEIVALLRSRAFTMGIGPAQTRYRHDIAASRLSFPATFAIHFAPTHPLAPRRAVTDDDLSGWRTRTTVPAYGRRRAEKLWTFNVLTGTTD